MTSPTRSTIEFRVLGPVEAWRDDQPLRIGGRRQRALLALLLLSPGRPISVDKLVEDLWRGKPPDGAEATLRVYVSRLRSALADDAVIARPPGYVLEVDADRIDAKRFERLLRDGRDALGRGASGLAADRLGAAFALWRGPALSDVADDGILALEARRLDELRLECREEWIEAQLHLGRHAELVAELERLVAEEPLRERLWRQLVLALYRCERHADALAAYRRARSLLSEELGLEPSEELRELERAVLRQEVAPPQPAEERQNLPAAVTSFVGRERELADLERLLREQRLITVTGIGGAGKTRLALEVAWRQVGAWRGGVWLIDLMPVSDPAQVPAAVARALAVTEQPDMSPLAVLLDELRTAELLLVLDNCEHLAEACAELTGQVLRACADVRVLATSRLALGEPGEFDYALDPLATPLHDTSPRDLGQFPSVRLFLERGRAARRDLTTDDEGLMTVGRICRELDGLPLAIELAAARARLLTVEEIAALLDDRFQFLRALRKVADPRHQTLRATMDWSYELLSDAERELLGQLSIFAGGFTLDAVATVCLRGDDALALELLAGLVDSSLVVAEDVKGGTRYRLLETIREYASEQLSKTGRADLVQLRHAEHFLEVARQATPDFVRFDPRKQKAGLATLDSEHDNLHAAMRWAVANRIDLALSLSVALRPYWLIRGHLRQGLEWLDQSLARSSPDTSDRVEGLAAAALLARIAGEFARAESYAEEAIAAGRATGSMRAVATCLNVLTTLSGLAGDYGRAQAYSSEAMGVAQSMGSSRIEAISLFILAEAALHTRRYDDLQEVGGRALELARSIDDEEVMALALNRLGMGALAESRLEQASSQLGKALEYATTLGFPAIAAVCCYGLAAVSAAWGEPARAARLLGAAEAFRRTSGFLLLPPEAAARADTLAALRRSLPHDELDAALEEGSRFGLDQAAEEARATNVAETCKHQGSGTTASA